MNCCVITFSIYRDYKLSWNYSLNKTFCFVTLNFTKKSSFFFGFVSTWRCNYAKVIYFLIITCVGTLQLLESVYCHIITWLDILITRAGYNFGYLLKSLLSVHSFIKGWALNFCEKLGYNFKVTFVVNRQLLAIIFLRAE